MMEFAWLWFIKSLKEGRKTFHKDNKSDSLNTGLSINPKICHESQKLQTYFSLNKLHIFIVTIYLNFLFVVF